MKDRFKKAQSCTQELGPTTISVPDPAPEANTPSPGTLELSPTIVEEYVDHQHSHLKRQSALKVRPPTTRTGGGDSRLSPFELQNTEGGVDQQDDQGVEEEPQEYYKVSQIVHLLNHQAHLGSMSTLNTTSSYSDEEDGEEEDENWQDWSDFDSDVSVTFVYSSIYFFES